MWRPSNNNKVETEEEEEESLAWNVVRKKRSRERGGKMRTELPDRASLPTILELEALSDNEVCSSYSSGSADDEDWRANSLSPAASPLLRALIKPSYAPQVVGSEVVGDGARLSHTKQHEPVVKPPIQTSSHSQSCRHDGDITESSRVCPFAMKLDKIKDKVR